MNHRFWALAYAVLLVGATFLADPRSAVATPIFGISGGATAQTFVVSGGKATEDIDPADTFGAITTPFTFSVFSSQPADFGSAASLARGTIRLGHISAEAGAAALISDSTLDGSVSGFGGVTAGWFDTLTVGGAPGTSTSARALVLFHAVPSVTGGPFGVSGFATLSGGVGPRSYSLGVNLVSTDLSPSFSANFPVAVGDEIHIQSLLNLFAGAGSNPAGGTKIVDINALSTGTMFVDLLDPGFSLQSASGHDYSFAPSAVPAVPAPASLGLLLLGTFGLLGRGFWRGSKQVG
jgi:hypothetical protein